MKKLLLALTFLITTMSFASIAQTVKKGVILLNGEKQTVKIRYSEYGSSSKDKIQIGAINASISRLSAGIEITAETKDGSKTISIYLESRFKEIQANLEQFLDMIKPANKSEITCDTDSKVNSMIIIYDNVEPYPAYVNCLKLN